eukprot:320488_1
MSAHHHHHVPLTDEPNDAIAAATIQQKVKRYKQKCIIFGCTLLIVIILLSVIIIVMIQNDSSSSSSNAYTPSPTSVPTMPLPEIKLNERYLTLQKCGLYPSYQKFIRINSKLHLSKFQNLCFDCFIHCQFDPHLSYCSCPIGQSPFIQKCNSNNIFQNYEFVEDKFLIGGRYQYTMIKQINKSICFSTLSSEIYGMTSMQQCNESNPAQHWIFSKYYIKSQLDNSLCLTAAYYPDKNCSSLSLKNFDYCNETLSVKQR